MTAEELLTVLVNVALVVFAMYTATDGCTSAATAFSKRRMSEAWPPRSGGARPQVGRQVVIKIARAKIARR